MKKILSGTIALATFTLPFLALAQTPPPTTAPEIDLIKALDTIANLIFWILLVISVIVLIWGGVKFVTSGGDPDKVKEAKNLIMYAIVGVIIALLARGIIKFIITYIK